MQYSAMAGFILPQDISPHSIATSVGCLALALLFPSGAILTPNVLLASDILRHGTGTWFLCLSGITNGAWFSTLQYCHWFSATQSLFHTRSISLAPVPLLMLLKVQPSDSQPFAFCCGLLSVLQAELVYTGQCHLQKQIMTTVVFLEYITGLC